MNIRVIPAELQEIKGFRMLFLHENNFQFIHNKCHDYGWADCYLLQADEIKLGYGAVWGRNERSERDAIFEFFIMKPYRNMASLFFNQLQQVSGAPFMECQTNDPLLSSMFFEFGKNISAEAILFKDEFQTQFTIEGTSFKKRSAETQVRDVDRQYELKQGDEVVATGGLMLNYNFPYADIYYEVNEKHRRKGFGTLMLQELKREAYLIGRVPAARCNITNTISKTALMKAGFGVCGHLLNGEFTRNSPE